MVKQTTAKPHIWCVHSHIEQEYFTPHEVAKRLRVDVTTITRWIRTGAIDAETIRQGKRNRHRIRKATIEKVETPSTHPGQLRSIYQQADVL